MLDILTLTIKRVVDDPVGLGLVAVEAALDDVADGSSTGLLAHTEAKSVHDGGFGRAIGNVWTLDTDSWGS